VSLLNEHHVELTNTELPSS